MACLVNPRIINRKYVKICNETGEDLDQYSNRVDYYVDVPCGRCINCVNSYMNNWRNRLMLEFEYMTKEERKNSYFVTLTIAPEYYEDALKDLYPFKKKFIDRIRKDVGSSPRYWLITEYGEKKGRLHMHGLFFNVNFDIYKLQNYWRYGIVDYSLLTDGAIKYCTSYITKGNEDIIVPPWRIQRVFCSPGIGKKYCEDNINIKYHHPKPGILNPIMQNSSQFLLPMPRYFRGKIFSDDEREDMTIQYFMEQSDDVIPDPPYKIGKRIYTDYTLYKRDCQSYIKQWKKLYLKRKKHGFKSERPDE